MVNYPHIDEVGEFLDKEVHLNYGYCKVVYEYNYEAVTLVIFRHDNEIIHEILLSRGQLLTKTWKTIVKEHLVTQMVKRQFDADLKELLK